MLDQILGRPSPTIRRSQVFLVLFFCIWRLYKGDGSVPHPHPLQSPSRTVSAAGPLPSGRISGAARKRRLWAWRIWVALVGRSRWSVGWADKLNARLKHLTPYQLILGVLTILYACRHLGDILGVGAPDPLAAMYTRSYYRATWINTALDAGFSQAMTIRPKWFRDICSVLFSAYYLVWANEGDEVLRRFRAVCTVEMLRVTWEKTRNPYLRLATAYQRPALPVVRNVSIPRPARSSRANLPPVKGMLFFAGSEEELAKATELVIDFPGGGFVAMGPDCHEERLRRWAKRTGKPVLGMDYGKAPEYPYPWAIEEGFDAYRTLMETKGEIIGIKSGKLGIVLTGDSAGGNICTTIMLRIVEHPSGIPLPVSVVLAYPALDFNFTSWMSPTNLRVLRTEQSETHIPGLAAGKDHMRHKSPLAVVDDVESRSKRRGRKQSWGQTISSTLTRMTTSPEGLKDAASKSSPTSPLASGWTRSLRRSMSTRVAGWLAPTEPDGESPETTSEGGEAGSEASESDEEQGQAGPSRAADKRKESDKALEERIKTPKEEGTFNLVAMTAVASPVAVMEEFPLEDEPEAATQAKRKKKAPIGTRLTMTSRVGYFQDRTISPSMMRAMAILYVGPHRNPNFETDYYISPLLSPPHVLEHFPPVYLICGERDPFVDDTIIFAGKIREAKRKRRSAAETAQQSKSARFGESLRMSSAGKPMGGGGAGSESEIPDHILRETDDDWVQIRIIEGWGHGFMQMAAIMKEVDSVLTDMADWIDESFARALATERDKQEIAAAHAAAKAAFKPNEPVLLSPEEQIIPPRSNLVKPAREYKSASDKGHGAADLGGALALEFTEDESEGMLTFTPKTRKKKTLPPSKFNPVPRRPSKEKLALPRSGSALNFDQDETGSSGEAMILKTPPLSVKSLPGPSQPRGSGAFALFSSRKSPGGAASDKKPPPSSAFTMGQTPPAGLYGSMTARRPSPSSGGTTSALSVPQEGKATNSLMRAASPALAAAGLVKQHVEHVSEAEIMRRRRIEAVFGMGETESAMPSDSDHDDDGFEM
ncbi:hypothetical protein JCM24511_04481 [Saitozyma sp. JCM 24511]|nr:hypothetical protein JCM24511_04481 [Saitozyma sp. JCM 24511]